MTNSVTRLLLKVSFISALLAGCQKPADECLAAASISRHGFAHNAIYGSEITVWGFVDYGNLYGNEGTKAILQEWWSGDGSDADSRRFNLKAHADDQTGSSFAVRVANDPGRDGLLGVFVAAARAGKPTQVLVKGKVFTFNAPTNITLLTGLSMEVASSRNIRVSAGCDAVSGNPNLSD